MRHWFIPLLLMAVTGFGQEVGIDAQSLLKRKFSFSTKLLHNPPRPFFQGRPYNLEFFSYLPKDSVETLSLFFKTDQTLEYREVPLKPYRGRYRFRYDPKLYPGDEITYFFVVVMKNAGLYAVPVYGDGKLAPFRVRPVDPIKYYESITPK